MDLCYKESLNNNNNNKALIRNGPGNVSRSKLKQDSNGLMSDAAMVDDCLAGNGMGAFGGGGEGGEDTFYESQSRELDQRRILHADAMIFADTSLYQGMANLKHSSLLTKREKQLEEIRKDAVKVMNNQRIYQSRRSKSRNKNSSGETGALVSHKKRISHREGVILNSLKFKDMGAAHPSEKLRKEKLFDANDTSKETIFTQLASMGYTPEELINVLDVLEHPSVFYSMNKTILHWLTYQRQRGYWSDRISLLVLVLTVSYGIGGMEILWRLMDQWHGMVFIIPYVVIYIVLCYPILSFELSVGQMLRGAPPKIYSQLWKRARGLGIAMVVFGCFTECIMHSRYPADLFLYLIYSFYSPPPWKLTDEEIRLCMSKPFSTCNDEKFCIFSVRASKCVGNVFQKSNSFYEESFFPYILNQKDIMGSSNFDVSIFISLTISWIFITTLQLFGLTHFSYVAAATLVLVTVVAIIHSSVAFHLVGSFDAAKYIFGEWKLEYLISSITIWTSCCRYALYELCIGIGIFSTVSSHSRIGCNVMWESYEVLTVQVINSGVMFLAAVGIVGYTALSLNVPYISLLHMTTSCPFVIFPVGFQFSKQMEITISVLFFASSAILCLTSISITMQMILATLNDTKLFCSTKSWKKIIPVCVIFYLCSLSVASKDGRLVLLFIEKYLGDIARISLALAICVLAGWIYGFYEQVEKLGLNTILIFDFIFWSGLTSSSIIAVFIDDAISYFLCIVIDICFMIIAGICAITIGPNINGKAPKFLKSKSKYFSLIPPILPIKTRLWWLFLGNTEKLRNEITKVVCGKQFFFARLTVFWTMSIKWIDIIILNISLIEMLENVVENTSNKRLNLSLVSTYWIIVVVSMWIFLISIVIIFFIFPDILLFYTQVPSFQTCTINELPPCPYVSKWKFKISPFFEEFFPSEMSSRMQEYLDMKNKFSPILSDLAASDYMNNIHTQDSMINDTGIHSGLCASSSSLKQLSLKMDSIVRSEHPFTK